MRTAGGVSPTYRFLLIVDGHSSRLHPDCMDKSKEIGFDVIIFPGGMTAVLQIMDQVFGSIKRDYTQRIATARVVSSGRVLDLQGRIRVWCESMAAFKAMGGAEKIKSAAAKLGIYPVSMEACLENFAKRTRAPAAEAAVAGGDLSLLAAATLCAAGMKRRRVSDITEAATAQLDDGPTDDDEAEGDGEDGRQAKKSRRVNYPMGAWSGSQMEAALAYKAAAAKAAEDEKVAKRAARAEKAAENAAHKAGAAERAAAKRAAREAAEAEVAARRAAKAQPAPSARPPTARQAARAAT